MTDVRCTECGARPASRDASRCSYCGTALPQPASDAPRPASGRGPDRFAGLASHPDWPELAVFEPTTRPVVREWTFRSRAAGVLVAICLTGAWFAWREDLPGPAAVLVVLAGLAAWAGVDALLVLRAFRRAPLERLPSAVLERFPEEIPGDGSAGTRHWLVLEGPGGLRTEQRVLRPLERRARPGDFGVAYLKGGYLLDFRAVADV